MNPPPIIKPSRAAQVIAVVLAVVVFVLLVINFAQRANYQEQLSHLREKTAAQRTIDQFQAPGGFPVAGKLSDAQLKQILAKAQTTGVTTDQSIRERDPAAAAMIRKGQSRGVQRLLGPLVDGLGLPKEQTLKLKNLLVDRKQAIEDARRAAEAEGLHDASLLRKAEDFATKETDDQIAQLLGPEEAAKLRTRVDVADQYNAIQNYLGLDLAFAGVPLSQDQGVALAVAMKELHYSPIPLASLARITEMSNPGINVNQVMLDRAAQVLTPEQFQIFQTNQADKLKEESLRLAEVQSLKRAPPH